MELVQRARTGGHGTVGGMAKTGVGDRCRYVDDAGTAWTCALMVERKGVLQPRKEGVLRKEEVEHVREGE